MKYLNRIITNGVIKYFNRITGTIETNKCVFIIIAFQQTFENHGFISMENVFFRYPVLERRRSKYNFRFHTFSIVENGYMSKEKEI